MGPITILTPISFNSFADWRVFSGDEEVSFGITSIKLLLISFTANLIDFIIDWPKFLLGPVIGAKIPIFNFSEAFAKFKNNKGNVMMTK